MGLSVWFVLLVALVGLLVLAVQARPSLFEQVADDLENGRNVGEEQLITKAKQAAPSLPRFNSIGNFYVAGVSSGGYMAGQLHVAYSSEISGAAIFAAGPWGCAGGQLERALSACTDDSEELGLPALIAAAVTASAGGFLDPLTNLENAPVWIFHGASDATVKKPVVDALYQFYLNFGSSTIYANTTNANHNWISPLGANPCEVSAAPYTANCGNLDPEGEFLSHILQRQVNPPTTGGLNGKLSPFSQDEYTLSRWGLDAAMLSMDTTGYVYSPESCNDNTTTCDVVMVLHGCEQSVSIVGMDLVQQAYMNEYADTNNLIIVYPQAIALTLGVVYNPKACWDWWGFLATDTLYANKGSYQMEVLMDMLRALKA